MYYLILDWYKDTVTQLRVKSAIEVLLDTDLPKSYDRKDFSNVCNRVYNHVFLQASNDKGWVAT
jgi:type I restriction enzyme R subunit